MIFERILGNENNKIFLNNILKNNTISHSYMFIGENSIGKMLFAKEFAKGILCTSDNNKPCEKCISCKKFEGKNHPDFFILDEEENTIKNEQIREINKNIIEKPIEGNKKVYIISNSENMTIQAQNSLLKTLEEPPEHATIILITSNENKMLTTIKSRCTKIYFNRLDYNDIKRILREQFNIENITDKMLKLANGSVERALMVQANEEKYNLIEDVFSNLDKIDEIELLKQKEKMFENKDDINSVLDYINVILENLCKKNPKYLNCIFDVEQAKERLIKNGNFDMTLDNMLFKIWEEING